MVTTDQFAGTERYVVEVSRRLTELGHEVFIGGEPAVMARLLLPQVRWQPGSDAKQALRALLGGGRRDIVHSHLTKSDFVALMAAPVTGGKRISTRHITAPRGFTPLARCLAVLVRRLLAREIAVSAWTSGQLERPTDLVLLNGVRFEPDVEQPRRDVVLVAQRLTPDKDTATALRAWAGSGLAAQGWRLALAGAGEQRLGLEQLARQLNVQASVDFLGWLPDPSEYFRTAGILLAPAPTEPCGLTILEAMAHGLPVVAAGAGGNLETVGRHPQAALFPPGVDAVAAQHLVRLADDAAGRADYGRSLRDLQRQQFTLDGHVERLETVYRDAVAGTAAR